MGMGGGWVGRGKPGAPKGKAGGKGGKGGVAGAALSAVSGVVRRVRSRGARRARQDADLPELEYRGVNALKTCAPPKSPTSNAESPTVIGLWANVYSAFTKEVHRPCYFLALIVFAYYVGFCYSSDCCHQGYRADTPGGCSCVPTGGACGCRGERPAWPTGAAS